MACNGLKNGLKNMDSLTLDNLESDIFVCTWHTSRENTIYPYNSVPFHFPLTQVGFLVCLFSIGPATAGSNYASSVLCGLAQLFPWLRRVNLKLKLEKVNVCARTRVSAL